MESWLIRQFARLTRWANTHPATFVALCVLVLLAIMAANYAFYWKLWNK